MTWRQKKNIIKDSKSFSGIVGITRKKPALLGWFWPCTTYIVIFYFQNERKIWYGYQLIIWSRRKQAYCHVTWWTAGDTVGSVHAFKYDEPIKCRWAPNAIDWYFDWLQASKDVQETLSSFLECGEKMAHAFVKGCLSEDGSRTF